MLFRTDDLDEFEDPPIPPTRRSDLAIMVGATLALSCTSGLVSWIATTWPW